MQPFDIARLAELNGALWLFDIKCRDIRPDGRDEGQPEDQRQAKQNTAWNTAIHRLMRVLGGMSSSKCAAPVESEANPIDDNRWIGGHLRDYGQSIYQEM